LHLDVIQHRLKRRFDLEIITHEPKIPYRETVTVPAEAMHRHRKQSGGRGQFGEVHLRIYPLPRDLHRSRFPGEICQQVALREDSHRPLRSDIQFGFSTASSAARFPTSSFRGRKGLRELLESRRAGGYRPGRRLRGGVFSAGPPGRQLRAAFKTAGRIAFKNAFLAARPVLLEPIVNLEVTIPSNTRAPSWAI